MVDLSLVKPSNLWYIVGFIATDGNLSSDGRHINITSKDTDHLIAIKKALGITNKIGSKLGISKTRISFLQFGDVKFYRFLERIGLTKKKSLTLKPLKIPNQYFHDFLRGVIDGDGNIQEWIHKSNGNAQWVVKIVSASPFFLPWLNRKIEKIIKVKGKIYSSKRSENSNPLYMLKYGKFAAKIILRKCYYSNSLVLDRKLKIAVKCIQSENGLSKYGMLIAT